MTKKHRIRIGIIVVIVCVMCFSDRSFADETTNKDIQFLGRSLNMIVGRLSRLWIIFAKIAGELLTNKWVYGEAIGLDVLLRKYWNVVKNFANFGLGFYFIYVIFKGLISTGKDSIEKTIKDTMLWLLIAGIGIQASRFLTAAVIDLSTIVMSAAGSFPSVVMSNSPYIESEVKESIGKAFDVKEGDVVTKAKLIKVGESLRKAKYVEFVKDTAGLEESVSLTKLVDILQPQPEDVSGPLYFIGFSILNIKDITSIDSRNEKGWKATIFNTIIQGGTTIIYGIEMAVLCIVAIMRILYLRMFIMISPIAILFRCIQQSGEKFGGNNKGFLNEFMTQLNFETVLINIFKPAIVVLGLGVAAIFAGLMSNIVTHSSSEPFSYRGVTLSSKEDPHEATQSEGDITYTSAIDHNLFNITLLNVGKTFLELILSVLTVILVYIIIKTAMTMGNGKDFIGKRINSIQDSVGNVLGSAPVIPVTTYDEQGAPVTNYIGASRIFDFKSGTSPLFTERIEYYKREVGKSDEKTRKTIEAWFNEEVSGSLSPADQTKIEKQIQDNNNGQGLANARDYIEELREKGNKKEGSGMKLGDTASNNGFWRKQLEYWLTERKGRPIDNVKGFGNLKQAYITAWNSMIKRRNEHKDKNDRTLKNMFEAGDQNQNMQAYLAFFLGKGDSRLKDATTWTWLRFADIDISKKDPATESSEESSEKSPAEASNTGGEPSAGTATGETPTDGGGETPAPQS